MGEWEKAQTKVIIGKECGRGLLPLPMTPLLWSHRPDMGSRGKPGHCGKARNRQARPAEQASGSPLVPRPGHRTWVGVRDAHFYPYSRKILMGVRGEGLGTAAGIDGLGTWNFPAGPPLGPFHKAR